MDRTTESLKTVYFAGPDVFRENTKDYYKDLLYTCDKYNLVVKTPIDNESDDCCEIYYRNLEMIRESDFVIANLEPFRGPSVDVGTALEIGFAVALGKKVFGYYNSKPDEYKDRLTHYDLSMSLDFPKIENFGLYDNLMIIHSCTHISSSLEESIAFVRKYSG